MKYLFFLSIITLTILLTACSENPPLFEVNGRVLQEGSDVPVEGVELIFHLFIPSGEFGTLGYYEIISNTITNANGEYSLVS